MLVQRYLYNFAASNNISMTTFDKHRLTEIILYILNKTKGLDYYHVFKILYFANITQLAKYGIPMMSDEFCALKDGPVPSILYSCIKEDTFCDEELHSLLNEGIQKGTDDACFMLEAKRDADMNYLSKADIESLDKSISENAQLSYWDLRAKSHGEEWKRVYYSKQGKKVMDVIGMAKDGNASDGMLEYIKDNLLIQQALA